MADANNDGYLDIYVSRNGESMTPSDRTNKLFINNKDLSFTESAKEYGLADAGFSSQAVFFDMDNDGDLDMYQVNQLPDGRLFSRYINIPEKRYQFYTDKLYINNDGFYQDISQQAGLSSKYTYGLSVSASDFNRDGFKDIMVVGNHYGVEIETTRYDAGSGLLLLGDGKNNFIATAPNHSGVHIPLDSRSITSININNERDILLVTNNNNALILLQKNK
jgi:hypothetical protein